MSAPGDLDQDEVLPKGSSRENVAARELGAGRILLVGADAAAIGDGDVGPRRSPDRVGDEVADRGFLRAHDRGAAVELACGRADLDVELLARARPRSS